MDNELYHHGILGMKWGVRRTEAQLARARGKKAPNYSEKQRTYDRKIYGRGAERRINKKMLKGEGIKSARHDEAVRRQRINSGKTIAATVATSALVVGGGAAVTMALKKKGFGNRIASDLLTSEVVNVGRSVINAMFR